MARITIPYAVADFAEMRERGFYYVDKTNYIPGLEDYNAPIFLRPRRFGKSLLISMLAHYYDRTKANRFEELFGGTWIGEHPTEEHNQYLVIRYDFSAMVMADDMEGVVQNFNDLNCGPVEVTVEHNRDLFGDFQFCRKLIIQKHTPYLRLCRFMFCDSYDKVIHWFIIVRCSCLSNHISSIWKRNGYRISFFVGKDFSCPIFSEYHWSSGIKIISSIFFHG